MERRSDAEEWREMRHGIRDMQQSMIALQTFRVGDQERLEDRFKRIDARLSHIETRMDSMSAQMSRWKGLGGFLTILFGGAIGAIATWLMGK